MESTLGSFPDASDDREFICNAGDLGSIPGSRRSPGEGNGYPLQFSCQNLQRPRIFIKESTHKVFKLSHIFLTPGHISLTIEQSCSNKRPHYRSI